MLTRRSLLAAGSALPLAACGLVARRPDSTEDAKRKNTPEDQWARTAWRYLENNTDYDSGLVAGMDRTPLFTAWNAGDALAAIVSAHELGIIEEREFDLRLSRVLGFLATMDLSGGVLPNKAYNFMTGKMVGFDNRPNDVGWSAVDVGRLLLWLKIVGQRHPRFAEYADKVVLRWNFCDVIDDCGELWGSARANGQVQRYQEGRLGYGQLAACGYAAWGFDTRTAGSWGNAQVFNVDGIAIRHDARDPRSTGASDAVLTMPYVLLGVEMGWRQPDGNTESKPLADKVFEVQQQRWRREQQLTARSDYQIREVPYVVLDSVFANGYPWNTVASDGRDYEKLALVNTRAAFGMWALWPGEYADRLVEGIQQLYDPDRGWFEGRREQGGGPEANITLSTNAAILETLLFKAKGPLYAPDAKPGLFDLKTADAFERLNRCTPRERGACRR